MGHVTLIRKTTGNFIDLVQVDESLSLNHLTNILVLD